MLAFKDLKPEVESVPNQKGAFIYTFIVEEATVTIRVIFNDEQSGADVLITNMTTLPNSHRSKGHGSMTLQWLCSHFKAGGSRNIQATQVQDSSERFWKKNGFVALGNEFGDYQLAQ